MYIVALAWIYVVLMMAVAEATNSNGTVLGAIITLVLYGVLPLSILVYIMRAPQRARAAKARLAADRVIEARSSDPETSEEKPLPDKP